jgi:hypothetical protein
MSNTLQSLLINYKGIINKSKIPAGTQIPSMGTQVPTGIWVTISLQHTWPRWCTLPYRKLPSLNKLSLVEKGNSHLKIGV